MVEAPASVVDDSNPVPLMPPVEQEIDPESAQHMREVEAARLQRLEWLDRMANQ